MGNLFKKIGKILSKLADVMIYGRERGWWDKEGNYHPEPKDEKKNNAIY